MNWGPFYEKKIEKKSHNAEKKLKAGEPLGFFNIHSVGKYQRIKGGPMVNFFEKKSHRAEKTLSFLDDVKNTTS